MPNKNTLDSFITLDNKLKPPSEPLPEPVCKSSITKEDCLKGLEDLVKLAKDNNLSGDDGVIALKDITYIKSYISAIENKPLKSRLYETLHARLEAAMGYINQWLTKDDKLLLLEAQRQVLDAARSYFIFKGDLETYWSYFPGDGKENTMKGVRQSRLSNFSDS